MTNRGARFLCTAACVAMLAGCFTLQHTVGNGPQGRDVVKTKQWYILFGIVPLNNADGGRMAGDAQDYRITTQAGIDDILINLVTGYVTVVSRTVTVEK